MSFLLQSSQKLVSNSTTTALRRAIAQSNQIIPNTFTRMGGHSIFTAAAVIIGDEVLNGKIKDTNSKYFADFCFKNNINLKNITVVPDEEDEIVDTIQRLKDKYDFIITTGGIGPTHDDITYEAIAKAFGVHVAIDEHLKQQMSELGSGKPKGEAAYKAQLRMATIPVSSKSKGVWVDTIYTNKFSWVPIVVLNHQVHIFPGIPQLFESMLNGLLPHIKHRIMNDELVRYYVATHMRESEMAPYLSRKQKESDHLGIKIGSYPHVNHGLNTVSIIGNINENKFIRELVKDIVKNVKGDEISKEQEAKYSS